MLSPKTLYFAYLLVKFADRAYGLNNHPSQASVQLNTVTSQRKVYLSKERGCKNGGLSKNRAIDHGDDKTEEDGGDWVEIELGEFYVNDFGDGDVDMCLKEVESQHLRGGLVVEGIKVRPKL